MTPIVKHRKSTRLTAVSLAVFRLNGQLIEWGNFFSKPQGLTTARWQVLGAIAMAPHPPNVPQIAAQMGVTRQGVLKQINLLLDEGLVQSLPNPMNKRSPLYSLTADGQATYGAVTRRWDKHVEEMSASFSNADLDATLRVLSVLSEIYETSPET